MSASKAEVTSCLQVQVHDLEAESSLWAWWGFGLSEVFAGHV